MVARIRTIKPDFWTDEKVVELSAFARLLFIGLWNFADDEGRMVLSPKRIKMQIFPADTLDISALFGEIRREKLIEVYAIDNIEYLQINSFAKHQKIDKRSASKLPSNSSSSPESPRIPPTEGKGKGKEEEEERKKEASHKKYEFEGKTIKLSKKDFDQWKVSFSAILDFKAGLMAADSWISGEPEDKRKQWFQIIPSLLNKKHQEALAKRPKGVDPNRKNPQKQTDPVVLKAIYGDDYESKAGNI